jgi:hypothetical protein
MSFLNIVSGLGRLVSGAAGNGIGGTLLKTAVAGFSLFAINNTLKKGQKTKTTISNTSEAAKPSQPDVKNPGRIDANSENRVPVVYGTAWVQGTITEAVMSSFNTRMTFCYTLSELTGTKLSDGLPSAFSLLAVETNDQTIQFKTAGATAGFEALTSTDREGNVDKSIDGLIRVWFFAGNSTTPLAPVGYTLGTTQNAYDIVPNWTTAHAMPDLIFCIVQVDYSPEKGLTTIPAFRFKIANTMTQPGDCLLDYMTNTRYGAGVAQAEIFDE